MNKAAPTPLEASLLTEPTISHEFFDLEIYAIYRAIAENFGNDAAWKVVWRAGEIAIEEIMKNKETTEDYLPALQKLADYLCHTGYANDIKVRRVGENELEYEMLNPAILPSAKRLIAESRVPAHISTSLMFALLSRLGLKAEMIGEPNLRPDAHDTGRSVSSASERPDGRATERWRLTAAK